MKDYIPYSDSEFDTFASRFVDEAQASGALAGLTATEIAQIGALFEAWGTSMARHVALRNEAKGARITKDEARRELTAKIRAMARVIQANASVEDSLRAKFGLPIRGANRIEDDGDAPSLTLDWSSRFRISVTWRDADSERRGRPAAATGVELAMCVRPDRSPRSEDMRIIGYFTRCPHIVEFPGEDVGKFAHFEARWVLRGGGRSAWSAQRSAVIPG